MIPDRSARVPGIQGIQGPPIASAIIDSVTTLNPGDNATVAVAFDGTTVHFAFGIPRGLIGECPVEIIGRKDHAEPQRRKEEGLSLRLRVFA